MFFTPKYTNTTPPFREFFHHNFPFFFDPLEQFDIFNIAFLNNVFFFLIFVIFCLLFNLFFLSDKKKRHSYYFVNKFIYKFIENLVTTKIEDRKEAIKYVPIFYYLFLFILISNFAGIVPFSYTSTSSLVLPFFLSTTFFGGIVFITIRKFKFKFFSGFLPSGVPFLIAPFLIIIEFLSYFMRFFSLAIRLFANMLSGHILMKILISVLWVLISSFAPIKEFFIVFLFFIVLAIIILEFIVCIMQAYVFTSLLSMYLNEGLNFGHH